MACKFGTYEVDNNRSKAKKPVRKTKKAQKCSCCAESSSEGSDYDDSCSGCSACYGSSSTCSCSECNMETESDDSCQGTACYPRGRKVTNKKAKGKELVCKNGTCEWVAPKPIKKPIETKTAAQKKNTKTKKTKSSRNCC